MKYFPMAAFLAFGFHAAAAQSLEAKIAAKSCECLEKEKVATETVVRNCISHSLVEVVMADSTKKYTSQLSTVESIQSTTKSVYALLVKQCKIATKPRED
ncbi:hypothetical protein [Hymenobacter sp. UYCo722]|uniref:hypothetical protein n=1 Tax=Hymenobacter sp. UYCo722 TaxID=3156335 RepID=UPI0033950A9F